MGKGPMGGLLIEFQGASQTIQPIDFLALFSLLFFLFLLRDESGLSYNLG
jgi:hypothetical protein